MVHILNRKNGDGALYDGSTCYRSFLQLVAETADDEQMRILAYCLMPNHWHMLVWPRTDGDLARFVRRFTIRHSLSWHARRRSIGRGHVYQGRFKSFVILDDTHLLTVCRYIERNPVRAGLVDEAEDWPWSSASARLAGHENGSIARQPIRLEPLPVPLPRDWRNWLNKPQTTGELDELRLSAQRGVPYGVNTAPY